MACCLTAPSHYLNQCWLIISEVLWHSPEGNFIWKARDMYPRCEFDYYLLILQPHLPGANDLTNMFWEPSVSAVVSMVIFTLSHPWPKGIVVSTFVFLSIHLDTCLLLVNNISAVQPTKFPILDLYLAQSLALPWFRNLMIWATLPTFARSVNVKPWISCHILIVAQLRVTRYFPLSCLQMAKLSGPKPQELYLWTFGIMG